jgi:hypothetical protein
MTIEVALVGLLALPSGVGVIGPLEAVESAALCSADRCEPECGGGRKL